MWTLLLIPSLARAEKTEGELPEFEDSKPVISCCVSKDIVERAVRTRLDEIRACQTTNTPGRGHLRWTVEPSSQIVEVSVDTGNVTRDSCLEAVVETFSFPELPCRLSVSYPLVFAVPDAPKQ